MINQLGDPLVYWFLRFFLIAILIYSGWSITYIDKGEKKFWLYSLPSIIAYSLIQGLRWNRGPDYLHYYQDLEGRLYTEYKEPLYLLWVDFFHWTGLDPSVAFVLYSLLLIVSFCFVIKHFPQSAIWAFPLFLIITGTSSENIIRHYLAVPFIMFAYAAYLENHKIRAIVCLLVVPMIHMSGIFGVVFFLGCIIISKYIPKVNEHFSYLLVCIYIFLYFFWDLKYLNSFANLLSIIDYDDQSWGSQYIIDADRWFTDEGSIAVVLGLRGTGASILNQLSLFLTNVLTIFWGYKVMCIHPRTNVLFWFTYFAILIKTISGDIEMYSRLYNWLIYLSPVLLGMIIQYKYKRAYMHTFVIVVFSINYAFYGLIRQIGSLLFGCAFIWDK